MRWKTNILLPGAILMIVSGMACSGSGQIETVTNPAPENSELPFLYADGDNALYMSWIQHTGNSGAAALGYSAYTGAGWSEPEIVASDSSWFVNWADFPSLIARDGKAVAVHWLDKIPGNSYSYNVEISLAGDSGGWSEPLIPHSDRTATEHGFVSMINWENNQVLAVWLDGRKTAGRAADEYDDLEKAMTLRGALISPDGGVIEEYLIDESVCDCCQTSLVRTPEGALVAYRDRTEEEIRDISVSRFRDGKWTEPETVHADNWKINACPVNGPSLAAGDSLVVLSWFTGAGDSSSVRAAVSRDSGETFSLPRSMNERQALGRTDAAVSKSAAYVSWLEKGDKKAALKVRSITMDGELSRPRTISAVNGSRRTGFPRMELFRNRLVFAWTDIDGPTPAIKTSRLSPDF